MHQRRVTRRDALARRRRMLECRKFYVYFCGADENLADARACGMLLYTEWSRANIVCVNRDHQHRIHERERMREKGVDRM